MPSKAAMIFAWIMFLCSEAMVAVGVLHLLRANSKWRDHAVLMTVSMVYVNGHGMLLFRLFPGMRTRILKYIHGLVHTAAAVLAGFAYTQIHGKKKQFSKLHFTLALTTAIAFVLEWVSAMLVFLYMYSDQARRRTFSGWHNFFGICILQLSIATVISIIQETNFDVYPAVTKELYNDPSITIISLVMYGVFVNSILLNPYVEWHLVGPI